MSKESGREFRFYLGAHDPNFMTSVKVPLFISQRVLSKVKRPCSYTKWALDSGAFTELSKYGRWLTSPGNYASMVRYWYDTIYGMEWAAIQDWMCEPFVLEKTGKTVVEHQRLTVQNYCRLLDLQPDIPWVPVLQGYEINEYMAHLRMYEDYGFDLTELSVVGVGSVCRRQSTDVDKAVNIITELYNSRINLHAFGFKITGLSRCASMLVSSDSMAWSIAGCRKTTKMYQETGKRRCSHNINPAHCKSCALEWRDNVMKSIAIGTR